MQEPVYILVVDDEAELANLFREFLNSVGYNTVSFTNPVLALENFKNNPNRFYIIITDLRMPGISGIDFTNRIRELNDKVTVFLMTAFDIIDVQHNPRYQSANFKGIIQKPIKLSDLKFMIEQTIQNSQG